MSISNDGSSNSSCNTNNTGMKSNTTGRKRSAAKRYKVILLGDEGVGKTSLMNRCTSDIFHDVHEPTVGIEYSSLLVPDYNIKLQLWDMACQDRFLCLIPQYIKDSAAIVIVFDVNRRESFLNACRMANYVRDFNREEESSGKPKPILCLVGNKIDMGHRMRQVGTAEGEDTAMEEEYLYFEVSCKAAYPNAKILTNTIAQKLGERDGISRVKEDADAAAGAYATVKDANKTRRLSQASSISSDKSTRVGNEHDLKSTMKNGGITDVTLDNGVGTYDKEKDPKVNSMESIGMGLRSFRLGWLSD